MADKTIAWTSPLESEDDTDVTMDEPSNSQISCVWVYLSSFQTGDDLVPLWWKNVSKLCKRCMSSKRSGLSYTELDLLNKIRRMHHLKQRFQWIATISHQMNDWKSALLSLPQVLIIVKLSNIFLTLRLSVGKKYLLTVLILSVKMKVVWNWKASSLLWTVRFNTDRERDFFSIYLKQ